MSRFINMMLAAINERMRTDAQERATITYDGLWVEHVMPRKWEAKWPLPNGDAEHHWGPASGVSVSNKQWRNELLHTLGNLTLLTAKLNDRISNGPFVDANAKTDKKRECEQRTILRVNDFIGERDSWDEAAIVDRGEEQQAATAEILRVDCLSGAVAGTVSSGGRREELPKAAAMLCREQGHCAAYAPRDVVPRARRRQRSPHAKRRPGVSGDRPERDAG